MGIQRDESSGHPRRGQTPRGLRRAARPLTRVALLCLVLSLGACGSSPVDMVEHPVTSTTPSRFAGQELQRSADPVESCADRPAPVESPGQGARTVAGIEVPREPERVLAIGAGAADTACALGLQGLLVGAGHLPAGSEIYLPRSIAALPRVELASPDLTARVRDLRPDVILVGHESGRPPVNPQTVDQLRAIAPVVVYPESGVDWAEGSRLVADTLGRPQAGVDVLLSVIGRARIVGERTGAPTTRVSLVRVGDIGGTPESWVAKPDSLGSLMLEAVGASRPPAQRTSGGKSVPPAPGSPAVGDPRSGDVIFAVVDAVPAEEKAARLLFRSPEWMSLTPVKDRRVFAVDAAVWTGSGPVAARAVIDDIAGSINGVAPVG